MVQVWYGERAVDFRIVRKCKIVLLAVEDRTEETLLKVMKRWINSMLRYTALG
jgi:hypothetical protein